MSHTPAPVNTAAPEGWRGASALVLAVLALQAGAAHAELLGTYPHRNGTVHLMTGLCREDGPGAGQLARQTVGLRDRQGCWGVDRAGNPVVTWSDGSELVLDDDKLRLARATAEPPQVRAGSPLPRPPVVVAPPTAMPRAQAAPAAAAEPPSRSAAARPDFARPAWCPNARFPHERLVCTDEELADRDLHLASLWRPYRRTLSRAVEAWHKSDYFRRLKACGDDRLCIIQEQETQMRFYGEGLPSEDEYGQVRSSPQR